MPYLTPETLPEETDCRSLFIPASTDWLALVSGALTELTKSWNWEQQGAVTVEEAITAMQTMIDAYYAGCAPCTLPGGYRIVRISSTGHLEELDGGAWVEPTGDYIIPYPAAREGGSPADQLCLASKNAANVLRILYESWSESWAAELTTDEALVAFIAALVAAVGFAFAPITFAIAAVMFVVFETAFELLEFLTADLWDEDFTQSIECLLLGCASNDDGVITFDWSCLNDELNARSSIIPLTDEQFRLYAQIGYIMYFIGGSDGLNLAGGTTEITDDDCSGCDADHCHRFDFSEGQLGWEIYVGAFAYGTYADGHFTAHSQEDGCSAHGYLYIYYDFPEVVPNISRVEGDFGSAIAPGDSILVQFTDDPTYQLTGWATAGTGILAAIPAGAFDTNRLRPQWNICGAGEFVLNSLTIYYTGAIITGLEDNC